mmetsp:Transcript_12686/g.30346  ORF Transcript_12686/g.30346 Transcript_12686/m.30346 type:complete len:306 (+) Transcript_12686:689-1606(+)
MTLSMSMQFLTSDQKVSRVSLELAKNDVWANAALSYPSAISCILSALKTCFLPPMVTSTSSTSWPSQCPPQYSKIKVYSIPGMVVNICCTPPDVSPQCPCRCKVVCCSNRCWWAPLILLPWLNSLHPDRSWSKTPFSTMFVFTVVVSRSQRASTKCSSSASFTPMSSPAKQTSKTHVSFQAFAKSLSSAMDSSHNLIARAWTVGSQSANVTWLAGFTPSGDGNITSFFGTPSPRRRAICLVLSSAARPLKFPQCPSWPPGICRMVIMASKCHWCLLINTFTSKGSSRSRPMTVSFLPTTDVARLW